MIRFKQSTEAPGHVNGRHNEPFRRLMAAVLQTAVDDRQGSAYWRSSGAGESDEGVHQANAYVASTDREWPFSFENLCVALDLDPGWLRRKLQKDPGA